MVVNSIPQMSSKQRTAVPSIDFKKSTGASASCSPLDSAQGTSTGHVDAKPCLHLQSSLKLRCGIEVPNRICKAASSEHMADGYFNPTQELCSAYRKWAEGGAGLIITGNIMIDRKFREGTRNCVLDELHCEKSYRDFATACKSNGAVALAQISHPGRQCPLSVTYARPPAPSDSSFKLPGVGIQLFRSAREMTADEIDGLVFQYAQSSAYAIDAGFDGVQIHAAHGYLISQFLSPRTNLRTDRYGGSAEARRLFLVNVLRLTRKMIGADKILAVKINSHDFIEGGLTQSESVDVIDQICPLVDVVEISGGSYESAAFMAQDSSANSFFVDFAREVKARTRHSNVAIMVTGGWRDCHKADVAIVSDEIDFIGLCRPLCADPALPLRWFRGVNNSAATVRFNIPLLKELLIPGLAFMWHRQCIVNTGYAKSMPSAHWLALLLILLVQSVRMYLFDPMHIF